MSKNKSPTCIAPINLPRRLCEGLDKAESLLEGGNVQVALELLLRPSHTAQFIH